MGKTKIPYAEMNWETTGGCEKIAEGCRRCYAVPLIGKRFANNPIHKGRYKGLVKDGNWTGKIKLFEDRLSQPLHRAIPTTYFVNSRSDTFHKDVPFEFINDIGCVMMDCPQHTFLLFTKRYARCLQWWEENHSPCRLPSNVHLYFSASTQVEMEEAWKYLEPLPAAVKGFSFEPLLESLCDIPPADSCIVGCESGPNRRICLEHWIEGVVTQRLRQKKAVYVKQIMIDGKVSADVSKFPADLQVRQF